MKSTIIILILTTAFAGFASQRNESSLDKSVSAAFESVSKTEIIKSDLIRYFCANNHFPESIIELIEALEIIEDTKTNIYSNYSGYSVLVDDYGYKFSVTLLEPGVSEKELEKNWTKYSFQTLSILKEEIPCVQ